MSEGRDKLCLFVCETNLLEVEALVVEWEDVEVRGFSCACGCTRLRWADLEMPPGTTQALVIGGRGLRGLGAPPKGTPPTRFIKLQMCLHLLVNPRLATTTIEQGAYIITPTWLKGWEARFTEMGFEGPSRGEFFREFAQELVLFDTEVDPKAPARLEEMAATLEIPSRRVPLGLDYPRLWIHKEVQRWRISCQRDEAKAKARQHAGALAEHVTAMDLLGRLAQGHEEPEVITTILDTFQMLFAPQRLHYLPVERGLLSQPDPPIPADLEAALRALKGVYAWTPSSRGFSLRISHEGEALGLIAVDELAFPEQRARYLNLALAITGVCGLAIRNARDQRRLVEMEKMASLSALVTGVAHEINTPAGIGRAAASHLEQQTQEITARFAARRMTQPQLERYLESTQASASLIHGHLSRIGRLIDAFRRVAVDQGPQARAPFHLCELLQDVITSISARVDPEAISIKVTCPEGLTITGAQEDWMSILLNLLTNSLRHGFGPQGSGRILIQAESRPEGLSLCYEDDGRGMSPEIHARLFDPFFTTDLQEGMGLGMHLVYNLITHRLGGTIQCETQLGGGARFFIEVPREAD